MITGIWLSYVTIRTHPNVPLSTQLPSQSQVPVWRLIIRFQRRDPTQAGVLDLTPLQNPSRHPRRPSWTRYRRIHLTYTLPPHQSPSLCTPTRCNLPGILGGHLLVLNLRHKLGGLPLDLRGQLSRLLKVPRRSRRPTRRFCSGKRMHRQRPTNACIADSLPQSLGYLSPIASPLLGDSRFT